MIENTKLKKCIQLNVLCFNLNLAHRKGNEKKVEKLIEEKKWN
jgi:hypothetical protein